MGSLFPGLLPLACLLHLSPGAAAIERRAQQIAHGQGKTQKGLAQTSPSVPLHPPPRTPQGGSIVLHSRGDVALPPLKSSRGDNISCWQNTATQRPKAQRGSNIFPSWTLRIQPLFLFLSKTCRLVLLSVSSSFLGFSTYLLHMKSCKGNSADSRSQRTCRGFHARVNLGGEGAREEGGGSDASPPPRRTTGREGWMLQGPRGRTMETHADEPPPETGGGVGGGTRMGGDVVLESVAVRTPTGGRQRRIQAFPSR